MNRWTADRLTAEIVVREFALYKTPNTKDEINEAWYNNWIEEEKAKLVAESNRVVDVLRTVIDRPFPYRDIIEVKIVYQMI